MLLLLRLLIKLFILQYNSRCKKRYNNGINRTHSSDSTTYDVQVFNDRRARPRRLTRKFQTPGTVSIDNPRVAVYVINPRCVPGILLRYLYTTRYLHWYVVLFLNTINLEIKKYHKLKLLETETKLK